MKSKLLYTFIAIIILPVDVLAAPSDYGRIFNSSRISVLVGQIILLLIISILLYLCVKHFIGKTTHKSAINFKPNSVNSTSCGTRTNKVCPYCNGKLFIDLGQLSSSRRELNGIDPGELEFYWANGVDSPVECARRICPHCKGRGTI